MRRRWRGRQRTTPVPPHAARGTRWSAAARATGPRAQHVCEGREGARGGWEVASLISARVCGGRGHLSRCAFDAIPAGIVARAAQEGVRPGAEANTGHL